MPELRFIDWREKARKELRPLTPEEEGPGADWTLLPDTRDTRDPEKVYAERHYGRA